MPRIASFHLQRPPTRCSPEFIALRDEFRTAGLELFHDFTANVYVVSRGRSVLTTCATLTAARRWLRRMS